MKVFTSSEVLLATFPVTNLHTLAVQKYFCMRFSSFIYENRKAGVLVLWPQTSWFVAWPPLDWSTYGLGARTAFFDSSYTPENNHYEVGK